MKDITVSEENAFRLKNGEKIKSLSGLVKKLKKMPKQLFEFHVRKNRNDFAFWIENKLLMKKLAEEIRKVKSRASMVRILQKHPLKKKKHLSQNKSKLMLEYQVRKENQPLLIASCITIGIVAGAAVTLLLMFL